MIRRASAIVSLVLASSLAVACGSDDEEAEPTVGEELCGYFMECGVVTGSRSYNECVEEVDKYASELTAAERRDGEIIIAECTQYSCERGLNCLCSQGILDCD